MTANFLPFAAWLLAQAHRTDDIGDLARAAKADPKFPRNGSYEEVRTRVIEAMADSDQWATLSAAHTIWKEEG